MKYKIKRNRRLFDKILYFILNNKCLGAYFVRIKGFYGDRFLECEKCGNRYQYGDVSLQSMIRLKEKSHIYNDLICQKRNYSKNIEFLQPYNIYKLLKRN